MAAGKCANCGETCSPDDLFCESCGYDFITGSLPSASAAPSTTSPSSGPPSNVAVENPGSAAADLDGSSAPPEQRTADDTADAAGQAVKAARAPSLVDVSARDIPRVLIRISSDPSFFAAMVTEGEVTLPDPLPPVQELELFGDEMHVGRTSDSRGVHPNVDVEALTGDPAVSTKHAILRVANDGSHTVTDVGSTNGTFVDDFGGDPIIQGVPVPLVSDSAVYLGAWTKIQIEAG